MAKIIKVFVCSDFHVIDSSQEGYEKGKVSFFDTAEAARNRPDDQLIKFIESEQLTADVALFCGDLGDGAYPSCVQAGWEFFHKVGEKLGSDLISATAGNHDIDSRHKHNNYDPRGMMQALTPNFPIEAIEISNEYWARHICLIEKDDYRLLLINSTAFHGYQESEKYMGRISPYMLRHIINKLDASVAKKINLLVVHHPLTEQSFDSQGSGDHVQNGDELIKLLGVGKYGEWIIIYGHKHYPYLAYAQSEGCNTTLLSSASLSAVPHSDYGQQGVNQFHILKFDTDVIEETGLCGEVYSYTWNKGSGWAKSRKGHGLPGRCGFGNRVSARLLAKRIANDIVETTTWEKISHKLHDLKYLTPVNVEQVVLELRTSCDLSVLEITEEDGLYQLQKK